MAVTMDADWVDMGVQPVPTSLATYVLNGQPIEEYDNWFNYSVVQDIQAVINDVINRYSANTILKADVANTPLALTVGEQTIVGRKSGSSIDALAIGIADDDMVQIDGAANVPVDNDYAKFTANGLEGRTYAEVRSDINVENGATADQTNTEIRDAVEAAADSNTFTDADHTKLNGVASGADVTGSNPPQVHGASVHTNITRKLFIPTTHAEGGIAVINNDFIGGVMTDGLLTRAFGVFQIPVDYVSGGLLTPVVIPTASGNIYTQLEYCHAANDQLCCTNSSANSQFPEAVTVDFIEELMNNKVVTNLAIGNTIGCQFLRWANVADDTVNADVYFIGFIFSYTANQ